MPDNSIPAGFSLEASPSSADNLARFGPIADQAADAAGVPRELFRWQIQHESGWNPVAVNPQAVKGEHASGIAQFLPSTAKQFNADPFDPEQSLHASAQYMRQLYDQTGDWFHALKRYGTVSDHSPEAVKQDAARVITPAAVPPGFEPEPPVGAIPPGFTPEPREPDPMLGLAPNPRLQMETALTPTEFFNRSQKFAERGIQNFGQLAHGLANAGNVQEEGALLGQAPDEQTREQGVSEAVHAGPLLPVSEFAPNPGFIHGSLQSAEGFTSPANLAIIGATMGAGSAAKALSGYALAAARALQTALGVYFTDQMAQGTGAAVDRAIAAYKKHDLEGVKENLGFGSVQALMAAFGIYHAASGAQGVLSTEVPKLPATPSNRWSVGHSGGFEPGKTPEIAKDLPVSGPPAAPEPGPGPTIDVQAEPPAEAATPADVPPGVPPQIPHFPHVEPHVESTLPTGFELESQPETPKTGDKSDKTPDWFKPGLPSEGEPIRKEGDQTTVSVVRWQRTPGTPEVNPQGATFFSIANQAGQSSDSTYAGATPAAIHWGGEHQVAGDISFSNPLELPTEKQGKYNLPLPEQIIRTLAGPAAADFDRHYSMEIQLHKFSVARGRGFLDQEAELEARLGIPPGTIADARQGPPGQIANSVAIALLRRDGYDGAIGKPAAPTDLAEAVRLSPLAPQAQDDALPKAAHVAPAVEPTTTSSSPAEPPERKNELNELSPTAKPGDRVSWHDPFVGKVTGTVQELREGGKTAAVRIESAEQPGMVQLGSVAGVDPGKLTTLPKAEKPAPAVTYFSGSHNEALASAATRRGDIGLMVTPLKPDLLGKAGQYPAIAIDNGVFSKKKPFDPDGFTKLIEKAAADPAIKSKVRFVVAPDVVGDAHATLAKFDEWADKIHALGLPVAFAAQNGIEFLPDQIPWSKMDVLFIGGDTAWKTGAHLPRDGGSAAQAWYDLFRQATARGIPVHMGRVNSATRLDTAEQGLGASSVDGNYIAFAPRANQPKLEQWLDRQNQLGRQTDIQREEAPDDGRPVEPEAETPAPETLSYRAKGNHKADIRVWQDDAGKWHGESDYNLQGQMGGSGGFAEALDSRAEAIAESTKMSRRHLEQYIRHNPNTPAGRAAKQLLAWLTKQAGAEETPAKEVGASSKKDSSRERPVAYGHAVEVAVPGEPKRYQARYALREAEHVEASHNPQSFEPNPNFEHRNDRDYSRAINGARPVEYSSPGTFDTGYVVKESHTAEHGHTVTDSRRNALGGNARLLTQQRVYARGGADADKLKAETIRAATTYGGISPDEAAKFEHPLLTRELEGDLSRAEAQNAITDFNKTGAASLTPAEQSLSDSRRVSPDTLDYLSFQIAEQGEDGTLAQVLSSSKGPAIIERLIADGVISANQRGKYITDKGVTAEGKQRITQLMVGRLFDSPAEFDATAPELRNKLEKIVGPLARVEVNPEWSLTEQTREAVSILNDARQHGIKNLDDLERQDTIFDKDLSDDPLAIARLIHAGQVKAAAAFRQYAADFEVFQKAEEGHAFDFLTPPTPREAFESAFLKEPEAGEKPEPLASLSGGKTQIERLASQGWYSQMVRTIEAKIPARVSPEQALAILKNPQHGVKADELKWTDLEDWLTKQSAPVTREEILDHANILTIDEKPATPKYQQYTLPGEKRDYTELLFKWTPPPPPAGPATQRWAKLFDKYDAQFGGERRYGGDEYSPAGYRWEQNGAIGAPDDPLTPDERREYDAAMDEADNEARRRGGQGAGDTSAYHSSHFSDKNVLAHARYDGRRDLDGKRVLFIEEIQSDWHQAGRQKGYRAGEGAKATAPHPGTWADYAAARGLDPLEPGDAGGEAYQEYSALMSAHHTAERDDLLKVPQAPFSKTWHEMVFRRLVRHAAEKGYDSVAWTTGKQQADRYSLAKHVSGVAFRIPDKHAFSPEVYKRTHPDWDAEKDPVGFLFYRRKAKHGEDADLLDWQAVKESDNLFRASELPEYIGKEAAQKLLATTPESVGHGDSRSQHVLAGENLQVGGHGMNGFYDSILPAYAAKFAKKWGEKPQLKQLPTNTFPFGAHYEGPERTLREVRHARKLAGGPDAMAIQRSPFTGAYLEGPSLAAYYHDLSLLEHHLELMSWEMPGVESNFHEAVNRVNTDEPGRLAALLGGRQKTGQRERAETQQVHSLAITPEMRKSVIEGQPLFVRSVPLEPGQKHSIESVARNIDWRITPATPRRPAILRVNQQAALAISEAGGIEQFDGSTLADESLDGIASEMRMNARGWRIQGTLTPEGEANIEALSKGLEEMQGQGWRAAVVTREDLPGAPFASIRKNARIESEELTHAQQVHYTAGYEPANHLTPSMRRFVLEHPAWKQGLWDALEKKRYGSNKSLHINILEAGAKLASGDPMGLTPEQAISYLKRYFQALRETHGLVPASEVFRFATRPIRTTLGVENAPREVPSAVRRTRPTRGQNRNYGHGEEVDTDTGDGANGPRATREPVRPLAEAGRSGDSGSLFGDAENQEVAETAARDRDQLQGQRLTAQFKAPLTREEQLKKLKRTKEDPAAGPQSDFFEAPPDKPQGSLFSKSKDDEGVTLGAGLGAMHPYLQRFLKGDVVPTLKGLAELARLYKGDLLKLLAPAAVEGAEPMALSVRHRAAELARATDVAHATLKAAGKYFDTRPDAENFDFIDRVETGAKQPTPELQAIHDILRPMLDGRRDAIRALGTGKLQKAIENYFPHLYKDPKTAQQVFENAGKRPLEGSKSFLKKRTIVTLKDAMAAPHNLEPFSANPVDFVLAKVREMDKYLAAHRIFADAKERGQLVAVDARDGQAPFGWKKIDDAMATIYGPSIQQISEYPNEGLHTGLDTVANALGLKQERGFLNLHGAIGRASRGGTVKTLHGTAEDVLAHEIGHQIDFRAGSGKRFVEQYPDAASAARLKQAYKTLKPGSGSTLADRQAARKELKDLAPQIQQRKAFAKELRDLADLRGGRKEYIRKREEKMAQLAQMWVGAREQFERTAPTVFKEWKQFLDQNPKLHALRDIEGNAKVQGLSQPYDVGGLVIKAHWWAPDAAARILNNYLSPGLRDKSAIVRSFLSVSNFMNQAQLGFSGFHAAFTLTEAATSHLALAIYQGVNGILDGDALSVAKSFKTAAFSPLAPFTSLMRGHQMLQEWNRPGSQSALIGQLADAAVIAGGRAKQESFYQTHIAERMMKAWREGNVFGATWRVPFAAFEIPTRIIMEGLVPRLKMGAFADMAEHELARLGPNAEPMDVERALAKVWDSVDNRFGQLVYDDLFWHKYTKDLAMMLVRSPGWNVGDIRELGGGYGDSATFATLSMKKVAGKGGRPEFTHRMAYIPAHLIVALTLGGLLYYVWHKKAPERLVDWFFPTDEHGQRWSLPTYVKDEFHWATAPLSTAGAKLNPVVPLAKAIATGKDYFGRKIAHAHHYPAELKQWAEYVLTQYEPLWMQQNHHALHRQTTADKILPELGITHAPKALDKHSSSGSVHLHR